MAVKQGFEVVRTRHIECIFWYRIYSMYTQTDIHTRTYTLDLRHKKINKFVNFKLMEFKSTIVIINSRLHPTL